MNKTPLLLLAAVMSATATMTASAQTFRYTELSELRASSALIPTPGAVAVRAGAAAARAGDEAHEGWMTDYAAAVKRAKAEKKTLLMNFTGSDWCPWCISLHREVFSQPEFQKYAGQNLVLLEVDFPNRKAQSAELKAQNEDLLQKYGVQGFPTVLVFDASGKQVGKLGYMAGGPKAFIAALQKLK